VSRTSEDDLGRPVVVPDDVARVVSIVPSLTEAIAVSAPGLLVGATDWCTHPAALDVRRIGGTKNPRVADILDLRPDVVIANEEENRAADLEALSDAGVAVWVTAPTTLPQALVSLDRMLRLGCRLERPSWLDAAEATWADPIEAPRMTALVPIWRRPWMALGRDTFAGDLLSRLGIDNALGDASERYPKVDLGTVFSDTRVDLVVLPDEPYAFGWDDGPEAFAEWGAAIACVSGRHLTWYGPSLVEAREVLIEAIANAQPPQM
jgi:ABC-type Fe3+-hydroxamate transport system substrate-binding protein